MSRTDFIDGLSMRRRIFIWALKNYLRYMSITPHISSNAMTGAIIQLCDNFVMLQGNKNAIELRYQYTSELRKLSRKLSEYIISKNFL